MSEISESRDPPPQPRQSFWKEFVIPTAQGLEAFGWRVVIGGLVIYLVARSLCP